MTGIPPAEAHMFQIFAIVACDYLWFTKNKAHHASLIPNVHIISSTINKTVLEHHSASLLGKQNCSTLLRFGSLLLLLISRLIMI
jgi:hypothetical protein